MNKCVFQGAFLSAFLLAVAAQAASPERQADVASKGAEVMPFDLKATTHVFTKTAEGGIQRVIAKNPADAQQVKLVREHLHDIRAAFMKGDFSAPSLIHGDEMPGLAQLKAAKPGEVVMAYEDVVGGAALTYRTTNTNLVMALHKWFDAQLSDHGTDAVAGHHQHGGGTVSKP